MTIEEQIKAREWNENLYIAMKAEDFDIFALNSLSQADIKWAMWNFNENADFENNPTGLNIRCVADTEEREPEWLVSGYIPRGQVTILAGDGGSGKTSLWCNLVAAVTVGNKSIFEQNIPFDDKREPGYCMFFSSEDPVDKVLRKRLRKSGANLNMIGYMDLTDPNFSLIKFDSIALANIIKTKKPALVVFDPLQSFIDGKINMGSRNAMRECLNPLVGLAESTGTSFLIICHTNKREKTYGRNRISDSSDIWDLCRAALIAGKTQDGLYYVSPEKSNNGALADSVLFSMDDGVATFRGYSKKHDREFMTESDVTIRQAPALADAKDIIVDLLEQEPEHKIDVKTLDSMVKNQGISLATLKRAKTDLAKNNIIKTISTGYGSTKKFIVVLMEQ